MRVQIGVCGVERDLEIEIDDSEAFMSQLEDAMSTGTRILWYDDEKGRRIGIPVQKIAYVTIDTRQSELSVGFA